MVMTRDVTATMLDVAEEFGLEFALQLMDAAATGKSPLLVHADRLLQLQRSMQELLQGGKSRDVGVDNPQSTDAA